MSGFFLDSGWNPVPENSPPAGKIYIVDPNRSLRVWDLMSQLAPDPWERLVFTDQTTIEALAAHSGSFSSKSEARRAGFFGQVFKGLELYGPLHRSFWVYNPNPGVVEPIFPRKKLRTTQWKEFLNTMGWIHPRTALLEGT